jgi:hypothetical protein
MSSLNVSSLPKASARITCEEAGDSDAGKLLYRQTSIVKLIKYCANGAGLKLLATWVPEKVREEVLRRARAEDLSASEWLRWLIIHNLQAGGGAAPASRPSDAPNPPRGEAASE